MQIKMKEVEIKEKKMMADVAADADKLALERERLQADMEKEGLRIGSHTAQVKAKLESQQQLDMLKAGLKAEEMQARNQAEGMRMGIDVAKTQQMLNQQVNKGE